MLDGRLIEDCLLMSQTRTFAPSEAMPLDIPAPKPEPPPEIMLGDEGMNGITTSTGYDRDFSI